MLSTQILKDNFKKVVDYIEGILKKKFGKPQRVQSFNRYPDSMSDSRLSVMDIFIYSQFMRNVLHNDAVAISRQTIPSVLEHIKHRCDAKTIRRSLKSLEDAGYIKKLDVNAFLGKSYPVYIMFGFNSNDDEVRSFFEDITNDANAHFEVAPLDKIDPSSTLDKPTLDTGVQE